MLAARAPAVAHTERLTRAPAKAAAAPTPVLLLRFLRAPNQASGFLFKDTVEVNALDDPEGACGSAVPNSAVPQQPPYLQGAAAAAQQRAVQSAAQSFRSCCCCVALPALVDAAAATPVTCWCDVLLCSSRCDDLLQ